MLEKFRTETAGRSVGGTIRSSILRHVMRNGNFMVTEIAEATGYSLTTIAKYAVSYTHLQGRRRAYFELRGHQIHLRKPL